MPMLPSQRPHVLTPSPSHESLMLRAAAATAKSAFFQKLPAELRRQILIEAFGARTMHMDLEFSYPMIPTPQSQARSTHCQLNIRPPNIHPHGLETDNAKPREWHWWSSVCHRAPGVEPSADECRIGRSTCCGLWPGELPGKCHIGVMGWILACRQAYAEGIDVLYSTNTVHMGHLNNMARLGTANMILNLHRLFNTQSMASIASLEMSWHLLRSNMDSSNYDPEELASLTRIMPPAFPHLKRLYISLWGGFYRGRNPGPDIVDKIEQALLVPFDAMVSGMTTEMKHCTIALHASNFNALCVRAMEADENSDRSDWVGCLQFWRAISQTEEGPMNHGGYWVRAGYLDAWKFLGCMKYAD